MLLILFLGCTKSQKVDPGLVQAHSVGTADIEFGVSITLAIVFPKANVADFEATWFRNGGESTAWACV